jgi:hypothetical protein
MLIRTKSSFQSGECELLKLVGNMYIMVPVTAKLDTIIYGSIWNGKDRRSGQRQSDGKKMYHVWYRFQKSKHSWPNTDSSDSVVKAAVDAVIDRKTHKELIALARCGRTSVLESDEEGWCLDCRVWRKGYDLSTSSNVAATKPEVTDKRYVSIEGNSLMFSTSHRGKSCLNLNNKQKRQSWKT